jgi:hypothetical protein
MNPDRKALMNAVAMVRLIRAKHPEFTNQQAIDMALEELKDRPSEIPQNSRKTFKKRK